MYKKAGKDILDCKSPMVVESVKFEKHCSIRIKCVKILRFRKRSGNMSRYSVFNVVSTRLKDIRS